MHGKTAALILVSLAFACAPSESEAEGPTKGNIPPRTPPTKNGPREVAILGAGCFWGVEAWMMKASGVVDIDVGYAGGKSAKVGYDEVSEGNTGHAEAVRITYDPSVISYDQLLTWFFKIHDPTTLNAQGNDHGSQYRSAIFPLTDAQAKTAIAVRQRASAAWHKALTTTIEPNPTWVKAEDYHQDYLVKHPGGYDNHFERPLSF